MTKIEKILTFPLSNGKIVKVIAVVEELEGEQLRISTSVGNELPTIRMTSIRDGYYVSDNND